MALRGSDVGLYRPGNLWLHRTPAGAKLAALFILGAGSFWLRRDPWLALASVVVIVLIYLSAGFGPRVIWRQWRPTVMVLVITALLNWWTSGDWRTAVSLIAMLTMLILAAALVTLTTRISDLTDVIVSCARPFERFGVDAERVGLAMALGIRSVPLVAALAAGVRDAQIARGNSRSWRAFAVPLLVTALRSGQAMGEALIARGVDDD